MYVLLQAVTAEAMGLLKGKELLLVGWTFCLCRQSSSVVGLSNLPCCLWP